MDELKKRETRKLVFMILGISAVVVGIGFAANHYLGKPKTADEDSEGEKKEGWSKDPFEGKQGHEPLAFWNF